MPKLSQHALGREKTREPENRASRVSAMWGCGFPSPASNSDVWPHIAVPRVSIGGLAGGGHG